MKLNVKLKLSPHVAFVVLLHIHRCESFLYIYNHLGVSLFIAFL